MTKIGDVATDEEIEALVDLAMAGHTRHCGWCCKEFKTRQELREARWSHIGPVHAECYEREKNGEAPNIKHLVGQYVHVSVPYGWVMGELRAPHVNYPNSYIVTTVGPSGKEEAVASFTANDVWYMNFFGDMDIEAGHTNIHIRLRPHEKESDDSE